MATVEGAWVLRQATTVAAFIYRTYHATLRVRLLLPDGTIVRTDEYPPDRKIFALSERDALAVAGLIAGTGCTVLVTISRDGDWASALLERLDCHVVRGSSRLGGVAALKGLLDALRTSNGPTAIVVDGPLGPADEAKNGAVVCGILTDRPVHAFAAAARFRVAFPGTWSGIYLPLPFSKVVVALDESLPIPESADTDQADDLSKQLSERLRALRRAAEGAVRRAKIRRSTTSGF